MIKQNNSLKGISDKFTWKLIRLFLITCKDNSFHHKINISKAGDRKSILETSQKILISISFLSVDFKQDVEE